jgi:hypothetical protein
LVARTAFASGQTGITSGLAVSVNGVNCDAVANWEGGDPRTTYGANVNASRIDYATLQLDFPLVPAAPIQSWLSDFTRGANPMRSLTLSEFVNDQVVETITLPSAGLFEVRVAGLDTTTVAAPHAVLSIQPALSSRSSITQHKLATAALGSVTGRGAPAVSSFRFTVSGLAGSTPLVRIDDIVLKLSGGNAAVANAGSTGQLMPGTLVLTMRSTDGAIWRAWRDSVMDYTTTSAHGPVADVRTATLEFLLGSGTASTFQLQFTGVALMRFSHLNSAEQFSQVELAYKGVTVGTDAAAAGTSATSPSPTANPPASPTPADSNPAARVPALITAVPPTPTRPPLDPTLVPRGSISTAADAPGAPVAPVSGAKATNQIDTPLAARAMQADKGARDPRGFPRPDGLVRTAFSASTYLWSGKEAQTESASYTSALSFDALVQSYRAAAEAAGAKLISSSESGDVSTRRVMLMTWRINGSDVDLRIYSTKTGGSEASISIVTK